MLREIRVTTPVELSRLLGVSHFRGPAELWAVAVDAVGDVLAVRRPMGGVTATGDALWIFAIVSQSLASLSPSSRFPPPLPGQRGNRARADRTHVVDTVELAPSGWRSWRQLRPDLRWAPHACWDVSGQGTSEWETRRVTSVTFDTIAPSATIAREVSSW